MLICYCLLSIFLLKGVWSMKRIKQEEILKKIEAMLPKTQILSAMVPLGPNNSGQRFSLDEMREAVETKEEIERLKKEL